MDLETKINSSTWEPVVFENQGEKILGIIHAPAGKEPSCRPGIVMCHGFTGDKIEPHRIFVRMARILADAGFYVLRFDFRGSGDSDGDFSDVTISGEIADTLKAIEYLSRREGVAREKIGILGLSLGGSIAACVSWRSPLIKAVALWAAAADLPAVFQANLEPEKMRLLSRTGYYDFNGNIVGMDFIEEIKRFNPVEEISKFKGDVLIIHGDADETVPLSNAYQFNNALKSKKEFIVIKGAGHTFDSEDWEKQVLMSTGDWFRKALL
ncbi:MAG: alpha/beta fold hydrolase [Candidatus Omnitrophica bacterium]|nr:alpha/beta fold hydrolase [Candidatus Omnitrophota bacterium]